MKTQVILFSILLIVQSCLSKIKAQTIQNHESPKIPMSWELQLGGSFLTNNHLAGNRSLTNTQTVSGSFYTYIDMPFGKKRTEHSLNGFTIRPGLGANIQTYGLDKTISHSNGKTEFIPFEINKTYNYSYLQQVFADIPVSITYSTLPFKNKKRMEFSLGGIIGYMVYSESCVSLALTNGYNTFTESRIKNMNPLHYGLSSKISLRKITKNAKCGFSYSVSGNYYLSELFNTVNNTPTKSFSVQVGIGFYLNN